MKITWIGQAGYIFESDGFRLVIDPYLSNSCAALGHHRFFDPPLDARELKPDAMFFTHDHLDHFDEETVRPVCEIYPYCRLMGPESVVKHIQKLGLANPFTPCSVGDKLNTGPFSLTVLQAWHSDPMAVGLLIEAEGHSLYNSGDSQLDPQLIPAIKEKCPSSRDPQSEGQETYSSGLDAVIICINGKLGNMAWQEALQVLEALQPRIGIPMHYGMFATNTQDPGPFIEGCDATGIKGVELTPGEEVEFSTLLQNG